VSVRLAALGVRAVLLDIEGTTTPMAFVHDVLFPYARARLTDPRLLALMDEDSKAPELKHAQGVIWEAGYHAGALRGQVYPDVAPAMRRWRAAGLVIGIYSSGSVLAQRLLFESTPEGDLTRLIDAFFDTGVGSKKDAASYLEIADRLGVPPAAIAFVSDVPAELAAAVDAGCRPILSLRPGNAAVADDVRWDAIRSFDEIV
jgi:enolase-phosphatase E1